jgi:hypothetical protein
MRTRCFRALPIQHMVLSLCRLGLEDDVMQGMGHQKRMVETVSMQKLLRITQWIIVTLCLSLGGYPGFSFTQVTVSTSAPVGIEKVFLANATNQFQAVLVANPLAQNTYALKLYGFNPNWNPSPTTKEAMAAAVAISTTTFIYGFADGMTYENNISIGLAGEMSNLCSSATNFMLIQSSTETFSRDTCVDVLSNLLQEFFQIDLSTPTPIPPQP